MAVDGFDINSSDLKSEFCNECNDRLLRAKDVLREYKQGVSTLVEFYERLHQEFDSLSGAARAANYSELEVYYRSVARYARLLSNKAHLGISADQHRVLQDAIGFVSQCGCHEKECLIHKSDGMQAMMETMRESTEQLTGM